MSYHLTGPQRAMLEFYDQRGPTSQNAARGTLGTWRSLIRRGLLRQSAGLGVIKTEITDAGRSALSTPAAKPADER